MELRLAKIKNKLIVALDVDDLGKARHWVRELKDSAGLFKVGHQLFTRHGPSAVKMVNDEGGRVFLDLKYHDIPNTVKGAVEAAVSLNVFMLNLHTLGGRAMMEKAAEAVRAKAEALNITPPILLGVTMLTSLGDADLNDLRIAPPIAEEVKHLASLAYEAGLNGVVASPREVSVVREILPREFVIVTPGVRFEQTNGDDQKRTLTPTEALKAGADYLVVGRPILQTSDPKKAAQKILEDMDGVVS